jgi:DNA transformation protein
MGNRGDKLSQDSVTSAELLVSKLWPIGGVTSKKMFGGHGIFHDGKMFGMVDSKGQSFLKVDDANRKNFEEMGAARHGRMPYFEIPEKILADPEELVKWAQQSIEISK